MSGEAFRAFFGWLDSYSASLTPVLDRFASWNPENAEGYQQLLNGFNNEVLDMRRLTKEEEAMVLSDAQNYCDRMASLLRGLANVAGLDFPELGDRFWTVAEAATSLLEDYKRRIVARHGDEELSASSVRPKPTTGELAVEAALSTE